MTTAADASTASACRPQSRSVTARPFKHVFSCCLRSSWKSPVSTMCIKGSSCAACAGAAIVTRDSAPSSSAATAAASPCSQQHAAAATAASLYSEDSALSRSCCRSRSSAWLPVDPYSSRHSSSASCGSCISLAATPIASSRQSPGEVQTGGHQLEGTQQRPFAPNTSRHRHCLPKMKKAAARSCRCWPSRTNAFF